MPKKRKGLCEACEAARNSDMATAPGHVVHPVTGIRAFTTCMATPNAQTAARFGIAGAMRQYWKSSMCRMEDVTVERLQLQKRAAAHCASLTLPAQQLFPLLNLALRVAGDYNSVTIRRLLGRIGQAEIKLTGDEIRMVLDLALKAKLSEKRTSRAPF
jgi:hypothetical protein